MSHDDDLDIDDKVSDIVVDEEQEHTTSIAAVPNPTTSTTTTTTSSSSNVKQGTLIGEKGEALHWVEKYRPNSLDELIGQTEIITTLQRLIGGDLPHLLFYGPAGVGKTSTIFALAKQIYGKHFKSMILELNASDERGIDVVRDRIKTFAGTRTLFNSGCKLVILDEADSMTAAAQAALRRVIEQYTRNCRFCFICNYLSKVIPALQSRCTRFRFGPLPKDAVQKRLVDIMADEKLVYTPDGLAALVKLGRGDMRRSLNILQSVSMSFDKVDEESVYLCTGQPRPAEIRQVTEWLLELPLHDAYANVSQLSVTRGLALQDIVTELHAFALRIDFPQMVRARLLVRLAECERRLCASCDERLQLAALCGAFRLAREEVTSAAVAQ
jgi:replication factor C subunit 3/5